MRVIIRDKLPDDLVSDDAIAIIDVFRACSTITHFLGSGGEVAYLCEYSQQASQLKEKATVDLCIGESDGFLPEGFDLQNSPVEVCNVDVRGKAAAFSTSNGTRIVNRALELEPSFLTLAGFNNMTSTVELIREKRPQRLFLVSAGTKNGRRAIEDDLCAFLLRNRLEGFHCDHELVANTIKGLADPVSRVELERGDYNPNDRRFCLSLDKFSFAVSVGKFGGLTTAKRSDRSND